MGCDLLQGFAREGLDRCFNPRTHMGCDNTPIWGMYKDSGFKPRTHMGCDKKFQSPHYLNNVSIHAPTWGATRFIDQQIKRNIMFQSTHPHGVRQERAKHASKSSMFQSTHPHGVRRKNRNFVVLQYLFQSTHPHGVRLNVVIFVNDF